MNLYPSTRSAATNSLRSAAESVPASLDPATHPIIAIHFFGVEPPRPVGPIAAEVVTDLRRRRKVQRLHRLGPRVLGEMLAEIGAERGITTIIDQKLERYAELDSEFLEAAGGNRFWPAPLREAKP